MNIRHFDKPVINEEPQWSDGIVSDQAGELFSLQDGRMARQASSCLLCPETQDSVLLYRSSQGQWFITQVLEKHQQNSAQLSVPGVERVCMQQQDISLLAHQSLSMNALQEMHLNALGGDLNLQAENIFTTARQHLIEQARDRIAKLANYALDVSGLMRMHSEQGLMTARQDIKIDAERISVG